MKKLNHETNVTDKQQFVTDKQQLERDFSKFIKEKYSKGPNKITVQFSKECIMCQLSGFLNKAEELLVQSDYEKNVLISRNYFIQQSKEEIESICYKVLKKKVTRFFPSYDLKRNEACWLIFLDEEE